MPRTQLIRLTLPLLLRDCRSPGLLRSVVGFLWGARGLEERADARGEIVESALPPALLERLIPSPALGDPFAQQAEESEALPVSCLRVEHGPQSVASLTHRGAGQRSPWRAVRAGHHAARAVAS